MNAGPPGDETDDCVDEGIGIHVVNELGVNAPGFETSEDANVDFVKCTSIHLA